MDPKTYKNKMMKLKNIINSSRNLDESDYDSLERRVKHLIKEGNNDLRGYELLAKINYNRGEYGKARSIYANLLDQGYSKRLCYHGLLKSYIMQNKFYPALEVLNDYIKCLSEDGNYFDFSLIYGLLSYLTNNDIEVEVSNYFYMFTNIEDQELAICYERLVEEVAKSNFNKALEDAIKCEEICRKKRIPCEFITLKTILEASKKKRITDAIISQKEAVHLSKSII